MPLPAETFKVFISHAAIPDSDLANWIADALDRIHVRAFVYERYQMGGQNRFEVIKSMISLCPYFLVLLTKDGIASQWVNQEIGYAVARGRSPIPIVEVDSYTGERLVSKGFVELHDQLLYYRNNERQLMSQVIYTFHRLLQPWRKWRDLIFLSCSCGYEFDGKLEFLKWWDAWLHDPNQIPFPIEWDCPSCRQKVSISFPDCHLLP